MTVESSRSSGYCSLDEELEDCFFTAKTTFFRNVQSKHPAKVNPMTTGAFRGGNKLPWSTRETGILPATPRRQSHVLVEWLGRGRAAL